jgi:hypothetical protein
VIDLEAAREARVAVEAAAALQRLEIRADGEGRGAVDAEQELLELRLRHDLRIEVRDEPDPLALDHRAQQAGEPHEMIRGFADEVDRAIAGRCGELAFRHRVVPVDAIEELGRRASYMLQFGKRHQGELPLAGGSRCARSTGPGRSSSSATRASARRSSIL